MISKRVNTADRVWRIKITDDWIRTHTAGQDEEGTHSKKLTIYMSTVLLEIEWQTNPIPCRRRSLETLADGK
jgi:hypothetical protein